MFQNRFFCMFFSSIFRCAYKSNRMLFAMWQPKKLWKKNSRLFAQSFMEIVIIGWNDGKITLNVCLKFVFFGNSSLVRPSWKIFAGLMIRCGENAPFTFDTVFFYLFWWWIFVKSLHMFSCYFFSVGVLCGYRLSSNKWFDWNSLLCLLLCKNEIT